MPASPLALPRPQASPEPVEVSIVMPCLNEAATLRACIDKARTAIRRHQLSAEIIVADNGSQDGSPSLAARAGARVVPAAPRGYGAAIRAGIEAARGTLIVIGDADDSYDFTEILPLIVKLREGCDLVMGNRFRGGIEAGAMPWKHRYIGNPALTTIGRLLFHAPVGDFHCGLRAVRRGAYRRLNLRTTGMEFASEMVIKAALQGMRIAEVPVRLHRDGRPRPPHLRSWRDGWRHLRFMLLFSPRWLFLYPGAALALAGLAVSAWLAGGPRRIGSVGLDIHTLLCAGFACLIGYQVIIFGVFTRVYAMRAGFLPPHPLLTRMMRRITLETGLLVGAALIVAGGAALGVAVASWGAVDFGALNPRLTMRALIPSLVLLALGFQTVFASFFLSILGIDQQQEDGRSEDAAQAA